MSQQPAAALARAEAFHRNGNFAEAERAYRAILAADPQNFGALSGLAGVNAQGGRMTEALPLIERALAIDPHAVEANATYANILHALDRPDDALAVWNEVLAVAPDAPPALYNRGNVLLALKRYAEALADYDRVVAQMPDNPAALYNRGYALQQLQRFGEALASFDRVLALMPDNFFALHNRGAALLGLKRFDAALASFEGALAVEAQDVEALTNRGIVLYELRRWPDALASYDRALAAQPDYAEAWANRANVLIDMSRVDEALASWDRAIALKPQFAEALANRAHALLELGRHAQAVQDYERALAIEPDYEYLPGLLFHARMHCCDWREYGQRAQVLISAVEEGRRAATPFALLGVTDSARDQLACARIWADDKFPGSPDSKRPFKYPARDRIKLAYLSGDFRDHAVAYLMADLFERHDRARFETFAISFYEAPGSGMQTRLKSTFDRFIDASSKSDAEIVREMRDLEIDIAVDLMGFSSRARTGVFMQRAAPVQVNYLGYPATMGADYIDYILADPFVISPANAGGYAEKVVRLPDVFQANSVRPPAAPISRIDAQLPPQAFVFCAFGNTYKITPPVFDVWLRLLDAVEGSVLMLLGSSDIACGNLRAHAAARGVDPERLRFMPRLDYAEYLGRYALADLFLDTFPFNGGATASDALWCGLPIVTCAGNAFASRMAGSLLNAAGLPELVTHSLAGYETLALQLATDRSRLAQLKAQLARGREACSLFDAERFRRQIESAYVAMWERNQRGEPPNAIEVQA